MSLTFAPSSESALPLTLVAPGGLESALADLPKAQAAWAKASCFAAKAGQVLVLPGEDGAPAGALVGLGDDAARARGRFFAATARRNLPGGTWAVASAPEGSDLQEFALGWLFEGYRFTRYKDGAAPKAQLVAPEGVDAGLIEATAEAEALVRDLINTPAADMGPAELEGAARELADKHGAEIKVTTGDDLLAANFPMIHAVGRAATAARAPRLIEMTWGSEGPALTLVGKGVCFDTGGLDLKPAASMGLMKKDMGGAANVLGLAALIMARGTACRLRVLIPAVENAVSADSFRPQDVLTARNGLTVEINNTDAEGRLVLADALALAAEDPAALTISMATLTGAARVALGPDVAPFYATEDSATTALSTAAAQVADPVWRLPFHEPYEALIEPGIADLDNAPKGGMAGSITAALFLRRFAPRPYMHFDIYGWTASAAPGRPVGGAGQGFRAIFAALPELLG
ncbi:leucyl aminopeptidase family protein [Pseudoroseicyclus sp. H15]